MKNLANYGVLQLNTKEMNETEGGWVLPVLYGLAALATLAAAYHDATCQICNPPPCPPPPTCT